MSQGLHVTVICSEDEQPEWSHTVGLMKAAVLYADRVQLMALLPPGKGLQLLFGMIRHEKERPPRAPTPPRIEAWDRQIEAVADPDMVMDNYDPLTALESREATPPPAAPTSNVVRREENITLPSDLDPNSQRMLDRALAAPSASLKEMIRLLSTDFVAPFSSHIRDSLNEHEPGEDDCLTMEQLFVTQVSRIVGSGLTHPLVDAQVAALLASHPSRSYRAARVPRIATVLRNNAAAVHLAARLFNRLPYFDDVPADELVDIRAGLSRPLVRFRAQFIKTAEAIGTMPWESGFVSECEHIVLTELEPAVAELEDEVGSQSFLRILVRKATDHPWRTTGLPSLGLALSRMIDIPSLVSLGLAVAPLTAGALDEWYEASHRRRRNAMYYYTRLKNELIKRK